MSGSSQQGAPQSTNFSQVAQHIQSLLGNQGTNDPMGPNQPPSGFTGGLFGGAHPGSGMGGASDFGSILGQLARQHLQSQPGGQLGLGAMGLLGSQHPQPPQQQGAQAQQPSDPTGSIISGLIAAFL